MILYKLYCITTTKYFYETDILSSHLYHWFKTDFNQEIDLSSSFQPSKNPKELINILLFF